MSKCQKNVQHGQLFIIYQLSKSQTAGLWIRLKISTANDLLHWVGSCVGSKVSANHKSSHKIEITQLVQDFFFTHQPIHQPIGRGVLTDNKSSNRPELSQLGQNLLNFLVIWHDPTHQPTNPYVSIDHKSSHRINYLDQVQIHSIFSDHSTQYFIVPFKKSVRLLESN